MTDLRQAAQRLIDVIEREGASPLDWPEYYALKAALEQQAEPVLQEIEQYRMQMAGISTAAFGYWKEGDGIHPDYDTLALRDVAKLYAKYDELYKAQPVRQAEPTCPDCKAAVLYECVACSSNNYPPKQQAEPPQRQWVGLTEDDIAQAMCRADAIFTGPMQFKFAKELEAKLKEKNNG